MSRPPKGIYVAGDRIVRFGYRDRTTRGGEEFHSVTDAAARALLRETTEEFAELAWIGSTIVRRPQSEIDARLRADVMAADDAHFEQDRVKAAFLVTFDEINVLRERAGLTPRTIKQAKGAYVKKLDR